MTTSSKSILTIERPGLAARAMLSGLAGAMLALTGCAAELDGDLLAEREVIEQDSHVLGELKTPDGVQLTFTVEYENDDNSDPVVAITELAPISAPSYLEHVRQRQATSLEAFQALAPAGSEAPAVLREAHEREAHQLGRSAELREFSLAGVMLSTPYDHASCDSYIAFQNSISDWWYAQHNMSSSNHSLTYVGGGLIMASMCNEDDNTEDYKNAQFCYENAFGLLVCGSAIVVPDGYRTNTIWYTATTDRQVRASIYDVRTYSYIAIGHLPPAG